MKPEDRIFNMLFKEMHFDNNLKSMLAKQTVQFKYELINFLTECRNLREYEKLTERLENGQ